MPEDVIGKTIKELAGEGEVRIKPLPSHKFNTSRKAPMAIYGDRKYPRYFPRAGEKNWRQSCDREALYAHNSVAVFDMSDERARFSVIGPQAEALLKALEFPSQESTFGWEVLLPFEEGAEAFAQLATQAEAMEGGAIGLEAQNVLKVEAGIFPISAQDTDHKLECIGVKPIGAVQKLLAGSLAFEVGATARRELIKGHLVSACYSPHLGHMIGLGMVENGRARIGDHIRFVDLVRQFDTLCEITEPVFVRHLKMEAS